MWLLYVTAARLGGGACLISVVTICHDCKTWWRRACLISVVTIYVTAARLGGGGMFDQCGCYMSLLQDLVEGACLISVVTICLCCKTWWRRHV